MRRHPAPDRRLFANYHALEHPWISKAHRFGHLSVEGCECGFAKWWRQFVEVVSYFVYGAVLWLGQLSRAREGVFFEEEPDLVAAGEEVVVADVSVVLAGGKSGHRVVGEGERGEHLFRFGEEGGDGGGGEGVGDEQIAIRFEGGELFGRELCR